MLARLDPSAPGAKGQKGRVSKQESQEEPSRKVSSEESAKALAGAALAGAALMDGDQAQVADLIVLDDTDQTPVAFGGSSSSGCAATGAKLHRQAITFEVSVRTELGDRIFVVGGGRSALSEETRVMTPRKESRIISDAIISHSLYQGECPRNLG